MSKLAHNVESILNVNTWLYFCSDWVNFILPDWLKFKLINSLYSKQFPLLEKSFFFLSILGKYLWIALFVHRSHWLWLEISAKVKSFLQKIRKQNKEAVKNRCNYFIGLHYKSFCNKYNHWEVRQMYLLLFN